MSAIPARSSEDGFQAWESHFVGYRLLLRKYRKDPRPHQVAFKIEKFWDWLRDQETLPGTITPYHFVCYARALQSSELCIQVDSYAPATISLYLGAAKAWTRHLYKTGVLFQDPFQEFSANHPQKGVYERPLLVEQVGKILSYPDRSSLYGLREKALLELLYGSGMRCSEALNLTLESLDLSRRQVSLRDTKNGWDRTVPITRATSVHLVQYLKEARPKLQSPRSASALFLNRYGCQLGREAVIRLAARISDALGFKFTTHSLRHACATHLLEGGGQCAGYCRASGTFRPGLDCSLC